MQKIYKAAASESLKSDKLLQISSTSTCWNESDVNSPSSCKLRESSPYLCLNSSLKNGLPKKTEGTNSKCSSLIDNGIFNDSEDDSESETKSLNDKSCYHRKVQEDLKTIFDLNISLHEDKNLECDSSVDKPYFKIKDSLKFLSDSLKDQSLINSKSWDDYIRSRLKKILNKKKGSVSLQQLLPLCESIGLIDPIFQEVSNFIYNIN